MLLLGSTGAILKYLSLFCAVFFISDLLYMREHLYN